MRMLLLLLAGLLAWGCWRWVFGKSGHLAEGPLRNEPRAARPAAAPAASGPSITFTFAAAERFDFALRASSGSHSSATTLAAIWLITAAPYPVSAPTIRTLSVGLIAA